MWVQSLGQEDAPGGGHGNPLQYSCLENPMDRGAWWATVHRVAQSQTWLKRLSSHALCAHERVKFLLLKSVHFLPKKNGSGGWITLARRVDLTCMQSSVQPLGTTQVFVFCFFFTMIAICGNQISYQVFAWLCDVNKFNTLYSHYGNE